MRDPRDKSPFPTPHELQAQLVLVEQDIRFLADANSLTRRLDCHNTDSRYAPAMDLLFRLVDAMAVAAMEKLRAAGAGLTDDLPF